MRLGRLMSYIDMFVDLAKVREANGKNQ